MNRLAGLWIWIVAVIALLAVAGCSKLKRETANESLANLIVGTWRAPQGGGITLNDDGTYTADLISAQVNGKWELDKPWLRLFASSGAHTDWTLESWDFKAQPSWMVVSTGLDRTTFYRGGFPAAQVPANGTTARSNVVPPSTRSFTAPASAWQSAPRTMICSSCNGTGRCSSCSGQGHAPCYRCNGSGQEKSFHSLSDPMGDWSMETCSSCGGTGIGDQCIVCGGSGRCSLCGGTGKIQL